MGWKLSRFISEARTLDIADDAQLAQAMAMARQLHGSDKAVSKRFDFYAESCRYEGLLGGRAAIDIPEHAALAARFDRLHAHVERDQAPVCLTHNDFFSLNILVDGQGALHLIDWEYAGMADYASDFGTFAVCEQLPAERARQALALYFGREPTLEELRHNYAFAAFAGWCWYLWSLYKEAQGELVGEWLHIYYRMGKRYLKAALALYEGDGAEEKAEGEAAGA